MGVSGPTPTGWHHEIYNLTAPLVPDDLPQQVGLVGLPGLLFCSGAGGSHRFLSLTFSHGNGWLLSICRSFRSGCGWIEPVFEQSGDVTLDGFQLIQLQPWIDDGEDVAAGGMFVDKDSLAITVDLFF